MATGFGNSVGMGLIAEGLSDLFMAYRGYATRQLNWQDYCKQKAISLIISAVSAGYSKIKDAANGLSTLASEVTKEGLEQVGSQIVSNSKTVAKEMLKTGKNLKSLTFKYVGVKTGEAVAREALNNGVSYLCNLSFDQIKPQISEHIQYKVKSMFCRDNLNTLLRKMFALDKLSNSQSLQGTVNKIIAETINPESSYLRKQWDSIGVPLLKGILSDEKYFGSAFSMALRIIGTLNGLYEIQAILEKVYEELVKKLKHIDENTLTITMVLTKSLDGISKDTARNISSELRRFNIINESNSLNVELNSSNFEWKNKLSSFKNESKENESVFVFLSDFYEKYIEIELDEFGEMIRSISNQITDQIVRIIESQLITPWSTLAVSSVTDAFSKRIQHHFIVNKEENSDSHNEDQKKYDELKKKKESQQKLSEDEKNFMKSYGEYRTIGEQVNYNAKDYSLAYTQCEAAYYAQKEKTSKNVSKEIKALADEVRDNKPADLAEMFVAANKNGIKIKVVNSKNYQKTDEDIEDGVEIVYVEPGVSCGSNEVPVGHAYYMDANGSFVDVITKPNDCFYGVLSKILENKGVDKTIENLRNETANAIEKNANYAKVLDARKWIYERYPTSANNLLFSAGMKLENGEIKLELSDKSDGDDDLDLLNKAVKYNKNRGGVYQQYFTVSK